MDFPKFYKKAPMTYILIILLFGRVPSSWLLEILHKYL